MSDHDSPLILFTGGGSSGHVTPNLPLISACRQQGYRTAYVGSKHGLERDIISEIDIPYTAISTGKFRRYFSLANVRDLVLIGLGILKALIVIGLLRPTVVFSKGGFVAFPVVLAAWSWRIPVIAHESDLSPGLATRLCLPFVQALGSSFEGTAAFIPRYQHKVHHTGSPIRSALFSGSRDMGLAATGLSGQRPILLVFGGGQGAQRINDALWETLPALLLDFDVVHLTGKGKLREDIHADGYVQRDYISEGFEHLLACADMVISRAGANTLYELLALKKPHLLIPLSRLASRGDQLENAAYFEKKGLSLVLSDDEHLDGQAFFKAVSGLYRQCRAQEAALAQVSLPDAVPSLMRLINAAI